MQRAQITSRGGLIDNSPVVDEKGKGCARGRGRQRILLSIKVKKKHNKVARKTSPCFPCQEKKVHREGWGGGKEGQRHGAVGTLSFGCGGKRKKKGKKKEWEKINRKDEREFWQSKAGGECTHRLDDKSGGGERENKKGTRGFAAKEKTRSYTNHGDLTSHAWKNSARV